MNKKKYLFKLKKADKAYYEGHPIMDDSKYDKLKDKFKGKYPNSSYLKQIGSKDIKGKKVKLPIKMGSLIKCRPDTIKDWVKNVPSTKGLYANIFVITPKLDGLAGLLKYNKDGKFIAAYSRGNGIIGRNITHLAKYIPGVPENMEYSSQDYKKLIKENVYIRGEFIIKGEDFKSLKDKDYKNPRNFCAGMLNKKEPDKKLGKMLFIAYSFEDDVSRDKVVEFSRLFSTNFISVLNFNFINKNYFDLVKKTKKFNHKVYITKEDLTSDKFFKRKIKQYKELLDIPQDGLVIEAVDTETKEKMGMERDGITPAYARSIKVNIEDHDFKIGVVKDINWDITYRGIYKPVVHLKKPLDFDGVSVSKVYAHNYGWVKAMGIGLDSKIKIIRSGDVIPYIVSTEKIGKSKFPRKCIHCNTSLKETHQIEVEFGKHIGNLSKYSSDLYCPNRKCTGQSIKQLKTFYKVINIDGIGPGIIDQLIKAGYTSVSDMLKIKSKNLEKLEGFGSKRANKISLELRNSLKNLSLAKLMHASGLFSNYITSLGEKKLQLIINSLKIENDFYTHNNKNLILSRCNIHKLLHKTKGLGTSAYDIFYINFPYFVLFYKKIYKHVKLKNLELKSNLLQGQRICFTGFRDKSLEDYIILNGGIVTNTISKNTNKLIYKKDTVSIKIEKAKRLNIPCIVFDKNTKEFLTK